MAVGNEGRDGPRRSPVSCQLGEQGAVAQRAARIELRDRQPTLVTGGRNRSAQDRRSGPKRCNRLKGRRYAFPCNHYIALAKPSTPRNYS